MKKTTRVSVVAQRAQSEVLTAFVAQRVQSKVLLPLGEDGRGIKHVHFFPEPFATVHPEIVRIQPSDAIAQPNKATPYRRLRVQQCPVDAAVVLFVSTGDPPSPPEPAAAKHDEHHRRGRAQYTCDCVQSWTLRAPHDAGLHFARHRQVLSTHTFVVV